MLKNTIFLLMCLFTLTLSTALAMGTMTPAYGTELEPEYVEIANYYDNRKAVVTVTADDWYQYTWAKFEAMSSMLTAKRIAYTGGVITDFIVNWTQIQYWLEQGYAEAASHGRSHLEDPSYGDYDSEIGGSKQDIIENLILPSSFSVGSSEYVYAWIEPYGKSDSTIRQKLGQYRYLADRMVNINDTWATWDAANGLFNRIGFSIRMEIDYGTNPATLNAKFDIVYNAGGVYHLMTHPQDADWSSGQYADVHTSYISNREDVWYVNFGLLYLYRWIATQNVVEVTSTGSLQDKVFRLSMSSTDRTNYGAKYPITYVFDLPPSWTSAYVNYCFRETDSWSPLEVKSSSDFFNGVNAVRFDYTTHRAYVSVGFGDVSNDIFLQVLPQDTQPVVDFTASPTSGTIPLTVNFIDASTSYEGIASWSWDFGDGETSTEQNPTHVYLQDGTYTVTLTVVDADGDSDTETKTDYITADDSEPLAGFTASPTSGLEPQAIGFTDTTFSYEGIVSWNWSFGDGETSTEQNPTHTYPSAGEYTVSLTVSEADGSHDTETKSSYITVDDTNPTASFTYSPPSPLEGDPVAFDASGSTGYDQPLSYSWNFGDGSSGEGVNPTHTYATNGDYLVTLTVTDADGSTDSTSLSATVSDRDPIPDFVASPTSGTEPLQVNFEDNSTSYDGIVNWIWNFGDGQTSTEQNPTHTYTQSGNFTVSLTVQELDGDNYTETKNDHIMIKKKPYITVISEYGAPTPSQWVEEGGSLNVSVTSPTEDDGSGVRHRCTGYKIDGGPLVNGTSYLFTEVNSPHTITFEWTTQYALTVNSAYGAPIGFGWYGEGSTAYAALDTGVVNGETGIRYVFTQWSQDASGTSYSESDGVIMDGPKTATANWITQYYLSLKTDPTGLSPQPIVYPTGLWYDKGTQVNLTAQPSEGYNFDHWHINGGSQDSTANPVLLTMDAPQTTIAYYTAFTPTAPLLPKALVIIVGSATVFTIILASKKIRRTKPRPE